MTIASSTFHQTCSKKLLSKDGCKFDNKTIVRSFVFGWYKTAKLCHSVHPKSSMWRDFTRRAQCGVKVDLNFHLRQMNGLVSNDTGVLCRRGSEMKKFGAKQVDKG